LSQFSSFVYSTLQVGSFCFLRKAEKAFTFYLAKGLVVLAGLAIAIVFVVGMGLYAPVRAQSSLIGSVGNSPFSRLGLGESLPEGGSRQQALGEAGAGSGSTEHINLLNPAQLFYNRTANFEAISRIGIRSLSDGNVYQRSVRFSPLHISIALPVTKWGTLAVGLRQHTAVDYNVSQSNQIENDTNRYFNYYQGTGGLNQAFIASGIKLADGLTAGLALNYYFGSITRLTDANVGPSILSQSTRTRFNDVTLAPGLAYRKQVGKLRYGFGVTGELARYAAAKNEVVLNLYRGQGSTLVQILPTDTLAAEAPTRIWTPGTIRVGASIDKPGRWAAVGDVAYINYSKTAGIIVPEGIRSVFKMGGGFEFQPSPNSTRYLDVVYYRIGANYRQLPAVISGRGADEASFSLSMGLPILRKEARYTRPVLNTTITLGHRGTLGYGGIREVFGNLTLGIVLNDAQWFVRYKAD
jgi:hypothetical protein